MPLSKKYTIINCLMFIDRQSAHKSMYNVCTLYNVHISYSLLFEGRSVRDGESLSITQLQNTMKQTCHILRF